MTEADLAKEKTLRAAIAQKTADIATLNQSVNARLAELRDLEQQLADLTLSPERPSTDTTTDRTDKHTDASKGTSAR